VIREVALHARGEASHLIQKYSTCVCRIGASTPHTATSHTARDGPSARPHRRSLGTRLFRPTSLASQGLAGSNHSCGGVSSKKMALRPLASERRGPGCTASTAGPAVLAQLRDGTRARSYHSTQKNSIQCVPNPRCVEPGTRGTPVAHPWHTCLESSHRPVQPRITRRRPLQRAAFPAFAFSPHDYIPSPY